MVLPAMSNPCGSDVCPCHSSLTPSSLTLSPLPAPTQPIQYTQDCCIGPFLDACRCSSCECFSLTSIHAEKADIGLTLCMLGGVARSKAWMLSDNMQGSHALHYERGDLSCKTTAVIRMAPVVTVSYMHTWPSASAHMSPSALCVQ